MSYSLAITREPGLSEYLAQIKRYPMLSEKEERELTTRVYTTQDVAAAHTLVIGHLRLVAKLAFKMKGYGLAIMDLISEGAVGLMKAVKKFNPELGYRFSTYATWWIKASINEFIVRSWSLVKIGSTQAEQKLFFRLRGLKSKILAVHGGSSLSIEDTKKIASDLNVTAKDVKNMDLRLNSVLSLDYQADDESSMLETLEDTRQHHEITVSEEQDEKRKRDILNNALSTLSLREQEIIAARYQDEKKTNLEDLAQKYNVSSERIRQIESRALEKIKQLCLQAS